MRLPLGELKRVSVSLLVDQDVRWEGKPPNLKQVLIPPSPEKLKTIRDLVAGVISFKAERGDQLIVETLPFEATLRSEPPEPPAPASAGRAGLTRSRNGCVTRRCCIGAAGGLVAAAGAGCLRDAASPAEAAGHAAEVGTALPAGTGLSGVDAAASPSKRRWKPKWPAMRIGRRAWTPKPWMPSSCRLRAPASPKRSPSICARV